MYYESTSGRWWVRMASHHQEENRFVTMSYTCQCQCQCHHFQVWTAATKGYASWQDSGVN